MHRYALLTILLFLSGLTWAVPGMAVLESAFAFENAGETAVVILAGEHAKATSGGGSEVRVTFAVVIG